MRKASFIVHRSSFSGGEGETAGMPVLHEYMLGSVWKKLSFSISFCMSIYWRVVVFLQPRNGWAKMAEFSLPLFPSLFFFFFWFEFFFLGHLYAQTSISYHIISCQLQGNAVVAQVKPFGLSHSWTGKSDFIYIYAYINIVWGAPGGEPEMTVFSPALQLPVLFFY